MTNSEPQPTCYEAEKAILKICVEGVEKTTTLKLHLMDAEFTVDPLSLELTEPAKLVHNLLQSIGRKPDLDLLLALSSFNELKIKALKEYRRRLLHERVRVIRFKPPRKTRVHIVRLLAEITKPAIEIWQNGDTYLVGHDLDPAAVSVRLEILQREEDELKGIVEGIVTEDGSEIYTKAQLLEQWGLNPDSYIDVQEARTPHMWVYQTSDGLILISRRYLGLGDVHVRLYPAKTKQLKDLYDSLDPVGQKEFLRALARGAEVKMKREKKRRAKGKARENPGEYEEDEEALIEKLIETVAPYVRWAETGLRDEIAEYYLKYWDEILAGARDAVELDPLIQHIYEGLALPFYDPTTMPNMIVITGTNAGKSLMYSVVIGEEALADVTSVTLFGGVDPDTKKTRRGLIHKRRLALQIESLEANELRSVLNLGVNYMKSGTVPRGAATRMIISEGTAPLVFTGNPTRDPRNPDRKTLTLQALLMQGLLPNPEALGSRLLFFYKEETTKARIKDLDKLQHYWTIIREVRENLTLQRQLRKIWEHPLIRDWLSIYTPLDLDLPTDMPEDLAHYLSVLQREYGPRLKALALNRALLDLLPKVWTMKPDELAPLLIDYAEANYEYLRGALLDTIKTVASRAQGVDIRNFLDQQPAYLKIFLSACLRTAAELPEKTTLTLEDLRGAIGEAYKVLQQNGKIDDKARGYSKPSNVINRIKHTVSELIMGPKAEILAAAGITVTVTKDGEIKVIINPDTARLAATSKFFEYV